MQKLIQLTTASSVENSIESLIIVVKVFILLISIQSYVLPTEYYVEADD